MKLKDINHKKTKPRSIRASEETFHNLKIVGAITEQSQEQVLSSLLVDALNKLNNNGEN